MHLFLSKIYVPFLRKRMQESQRTETTQTGNIQNKKSSIVNNTMTAEMNKIDMKVKDTRNRNTADMDNIKAYSQVQTH